MTKNKLALTILLILALIILKPLLGKLWQDYQAYEVDWNASQCRVYGYMSDCVTKIKP